MRRKRKGIRPPDTVGLCRTDDFDTARQIKKQCGEDWKASRDQKVGSGSGRGEKRRLCAGGAASRVVMTAPPSVRLAADLPGRGLKRKLGCMEPATRIGRTEKLEDEYVLGHKIGKGRFGSVRLCRSKVDGKEFACKTLRKDGDETVHREVEIMQHISGHPGIVTLKAVFEDEKSFHLVMELCYGGRLIDQINKEVRYSEQRAAILLKELVTIIKYCHEMGVVHRDIKPENILLTASGKIKLADFGLAVRFTTGQKLSGRAGSPAYVAPEVLLGDYSEKVDIWAAGVLLHVLLVGALPFKGHSREAVFEEIKFTELDFVSGTWASVSDLAKDLVCRMLTRDTSKRITIDEILLHPWILFYTKCPSELMPRKPRIRSSKPILAMERIAALISSSLTTESSSNTRSEEQHDGNCFVDVLATAMARVSISETKRSRLCGPMHPIQQQRSSNMEANLCTAF
ncbi:serine/threonine-protein kinase PEPKR2-like [Zingiber officinale]|uniref:serine/threonine-protein kinase PEPKR2-like n=1 Tax=Zingiber officinale TaxID=94328 RepID=UPI001C4BAABB|nr:serine/threonine-protein kinase PEPKR2-like [Zingiber officinale]